MVTPKTSSRILHLVSFKLGEEEFALDIRQVQEINRPTQVTKIPNSESHIYGVINLRGKIIPVVDLKEKFGLPHQEATKDTRIMVVGMQNAGHIGLIVDSVSEVLRLPEETLDPPPMIIKGIRSEFIHAIGKMDDRLIFILDLFRLFKESEMSNIISGDSPAVETVEDANRKTQTMQRPPEIPSTDPALDEVVEVAKAMSEGNFQKEIHPDLYGQVGELAKYINATLKKLQHLEPHIKVTSEAIPQASIQLSEITRTTEEATHQIMSYIEQVLDNHDMMATHVGQLEASVTGRETNQSQIRELRRLVNEDQETLMEVMTGLSFQDITGQKIKKIIAMVEEIEKRILQLLVTFGIQHSPEAREEMLRTVTSSQDIKQDRVDEILKGFGF